jgi:predicted RNA-binding Zn-ribbon protein involved in translation (DUF1610 family)
MGGCRGRLPWHTVADLVRASAALRCKCGHVIHARHGDVPKSCPRCGTLFENAEFCWEV